MNDYEKKRKGSPVVKWILIGISILFVLVMLVLPLYTVIVESFKQGWETYKKAVTDEYTISAAGLTIEATFFAVLLNTVFGPSFILKEKNYLLLL